MNWQALGLAIACQVIKVVFRARAWQNILRSSYPASRIRFPVVFGAYVAGVGVNSIMPARGGDLVKLYLVKHRVPEARYATLAATLVVETLLDFVVATGLIVWALSIGVLPTHEVYSRLPTVDWRFFLRHERATAVGIGIAVLVGLVLVLWARRRVAGFWDRVKLGFAVLGDRRRFVLGVLLPQGLSWVFRIATVYFFLEAFGVHASIHNALLAQVVDSLATLFPATPGGAGTKQGLIVYLFRGSAISRPLLLAFSVGMNIVLTVSNLVLGLIAIALLARTLSFKRLRTASREEKKHEQPAA